MVSRKLETVGHIPREVSSHTCFYSKEEGGRIDGSVSSTCYCPSPILSGGLEIPSMMTFRSPRYITHQEMKNFMTKLVENVESDLDSDEFHIEMKENVMEEVKTVKWWLLPKLKREK